ncbi:MAG: hypothetical protein M0P52_00100 [Rhodoferax sp.]|jgi:hypothetical protein|nr:hypothetical protein [Rhodoferax sp.]
MTTIITITEMASMPGRYCCDHKTGTGRTFSTTHAGRDPAEAAAYAMSIAIYKSSYVIFGPERVLKHIPVELRSKS